MVKVQEELSQLKGINGSRLLKILEPILGNRTGRVEFLRSKSPGALKNRLPDSLSGVVNLQRVNDIRGINNFFCEVNSKLSMGGIFVGCVETLEHRRTRILRKFPWGLNYLYYSLDFVYKRVFPKFKFTSKIYFYLTNGRNRALSKSEVLGRLVYCGFEISDIQEINNMLFYKAIKMGSPSADPKPSTGIILRVNRIGYHGKPITVYKFRTMHPYAQYLQSYVFKENNLREGGKFANDFRITKWGRWMRRFWIDELPMIYNILRGDLKLVGVRPLSEHYLSLYTPEHKDLRIKGKPGLIPPFYADLPKSLDEIMESESRYMQSYVQDPLSTDFAYCLKAFQNIFFHKARSH